MKDASVFGIFGCIIPMQQVTVASESSQREKSQSSMQQDDKLKCVFLISGERSQGLHGFHGIDISRTTR